MTNYADNVATRATKEVLFFRAGYSATVPVWARGLAVNHSVKAEALRSALKTAWLCFNIYQNVNGLSSEMAAYHCCNASLETLEQQVEWHNQNGAKRILSDNTGAEPTNAEWNRFLTNTNRGTL